MFSIIYTSAVKEKLECKNHNLVLHMKALRKIAKKRMHKLRNMRQRIRKLLDK